MSEASYTAWDDNEYEWPPPEGWYRAEDGKWWPEGYGPTEAAGEGEDPGGEEAPEAADESHAPGPAFDATMTSILPAGGPGKPGGTTPEERLEAESQRPVYDELPPIDDVFGGRDPYAEDDDDADDRTSWTYDPDAAPPNIDDLAGIADERVDDRGEAIAEGPAGEPAESPPSDEVAVGHEVEETELVSDGDEVPDAEDEAHGRSADDDEVETIIVEEDAALDGIPLGADRLDDSDEEPDTGVDEEGVVVEEIDSAPAEPFGDETTVFAVVDDLDAPGGSDDGAPELEGDDEEGTIDGPDEPADDGDDDDELAHPDDELLVTGFHLGELPEDEPEPAGLRSETVLIDDPDLPLGPGRDAPIDTGDRLPGELFAATVREPAGALAGGGGPDRAYGDAPTVADAPDVDHRTDDHDRVATAPATRRSPWPKVAAGLAVLVAVGGLIAYLFLRPDDGPTGFDVDAALAETGAGSLSEPYSSGTGVVVFYNDEGSESERRWVIQVLETVTDRTEALVGEQGAALPPDGQALAVIRVRVAYQSGPSPGQLVDLTFSSIGSSLVLFDESASCQVDEGIDLTASLEPGQAVEGNLCWQIPTADLGDLKLAIEAGPVEGMVFMQLT